MVKRLLGAVVASSLAVAACSGGAANDRDESPRPGRTPLDAVTTTTDPAICASTPTTVGSDGRVLWSDGCNDARFDSAVSSLTAAVLRDMDPAELAAAVENACRNLREDGADPEASTKSAAVRALVNDDAWDAPAIWEFALLMKNSCPVDFGAIESLPSFAEPLRVTLRVQTTGTASVTMQDPLGGETTEPAAGDWVVGIQVVDPVDLRVDARFDRGESRSCSITVDDREVRRLELADDAEFPELRCELSAADLEAVAQKAE